MHALLYISPSVYDELLQVEVKHAFCASLVARIKSPYCGNSCKIINRAEHA